METTIDQLIADFHERALPSFTRRHIKLPWLPGKIDTIIGMRRSGKTYFLFQTIADLLAAGTPRKSIFYMNFEDERLLPMAATHLHLISDIYYRRYPHYKDRLCTFLFDEIQNIPGWELFVRRLLDTENVHICLTGSSARLLSHEIATSLRGRSMATEIFPFGFGEYLDGQEITVANGIHPGAKKRALVENRFRAYLLDGGFPEVQGLENEYRIRILQDYLDVVILRDLVERYRISNTVALRYLIRHIMNAPASLFSINKFYHGLKSQGIACGKNTLHEYLDYLSDSYLFFQVFLHTGSERARMVNPRKMYVIDTGLINACSRNLRPEWGHLLENFVFMELRRRYKIIEYYKTASGLEVDFIVAGRPARPPALIQVAAEMDKTSTRSRELKALDEAMKESGIREAIIVTLNHEEYLDTPAGHIHILPAWRWVLSSG